MLESLRRGATSWPAKILLSLLVVSFAIWGVADVFTGFDRGAVVAVGSEQITAERFQQAYQDEMNAISEQIGRRLTPEQARAFGLQTRVLTRLVGSSAIEQHAQELNLNLSDKALAQGLEKDPNFQGPDGKFSRQGFEGLLRQMGLSERGFLALRRKDELREQIIDTLSKSIVAPKPIVDMLHAWKQETRTADFFAIDAEKAAPVAEPDDAKLKETFEANKSLFMSPEYRKLAVLILSVDDMKKTIDIPEQDIKAAYERDKATYDTPEQRRVQQISFKDKAAAEAAKKEIDGGKGFGDVAKAAGMKDGDIDLGLVTKAQLIDPKIADAAFNLKKDEVSGVVEGTFTTVLLRVVQIEPAVIKTFDDVKQQVRDKLAAERAASEIQNIHDQVEDNRGAGKTLKEIAESLKLPFYELPQVSKGNLTPDEKPALNHPDAKTIIEAGFEAQPGIDHEPVELASTGYAWVDLLGVTESKLKPFDTVKAQVKNVYVNNERKRLVGELAKKLVERIDRGEAMDKLAAEVGGTVSTTQPLTRSTVPQGFPEAAVAPLFALAKDKGGSVPTTDGKSRVVFRLKEIKPAEPATKTQSETLAKDLDRDLQNDLIMAYVDALRTKLGVSVNQKELNRVLGTETQ
jgi:peptidyl-prolyl cis-trans isomerase D